MATELYLVSLLGHEEHWELFFHDDFDEIQAAIELVVAKRGIPIDTIGYRVMKFIDGVAIESVEYYPTEPADLSKRDGWRKPGKAEWKWCGKYRSRPRNERLWFTRFRRLTGLPKRRNEDVNDIE